MAFKVAGQKAEDSEFALKEDSGRVVVVVNNIDIGYFDGDGFNLYALDEDEQNKLPGIPFDNDGQVVIF